MAAPEFAVEAEGLGKAYRMFRRPLHRIIEGGTLGRVVKHDEFWALRDVDFKLRPGSSLGLVGANGAGKSTLMKVLSGVTAPTVGRYLIKGRVASLLELGAGFHLDFTGRANIVLNGVMLGFTRREMLAKVDEIVEFAELGAYIDEPVRTYSSGMGLRLGFAVAIAIDPDVLIIDEVFAVGDMYFQKKCIDKIYDFKRRGKTIIFCSHSLYDVRQLCDDALWLQNGVPASIGESVFVTNEYAAFQRDHIGSEKDVVGDTIPEIEPGEGEDGRPRAMPRVLDARIYRMGTDVETYEVTTGDSIEVRVWWENPDPESMPLHLGVVFTRADMTTVSGMGTHLDGRKLEGHGGCFVLELPNLQLLSGQLMVPILLLDEGGVHRYQQYLMPDNLVVRTQTRQVGLILLEHAWRYDADRPVPAVHAAAESDVERVGQEEGSAE